MDAHRILRAHLNPALKGPNWEVVLKSLAVGDQYVTETARFATDQMFLVSSSGRYLDRQAANRNLGRPENVGMKDAPFRSLVEHITNEKITLQSLKKVVRTFYGDSSTIAHTSSTTGPFSLTDGARLYFTVDGQDVVVVFKIADFASIETATPTEVAFVITRTLMLYGLDSYAIPEDGKVSIYSAAIGLGGSVRVVGGEAQDVLKFPSALPLSAAGIWDISRLPGNTTRWEYTGLNSPTLFLRKGDVANIYGPSISVENRGPLEVLAAGDDWFDVQTPTFTQQSLSVGEDAIRFYRPLLSTVYSRPSYALVASVGNRTEAILPATVPAVDRELSTASYLGPHGELHLEHISRIGGVVTATTTDSHDLEVGDWVTVSESVVSPTSGDTGFLPIGDPIGEKPCIVEMSDGRLFVANGMEFHIYDPTHETWALVWSDPDKDMYGEVKVAALDNSRVFVIGLQLGVGVKTFIFDPTVMELIPAAPPITITSAPIAVAKMKDGRIFVYPGMGNEEAEIFDPVEGVFVEAPGKTNMTRLVVSATTIPDGRILIIGDATDAELFNPINGHFRKLFGQVRVDDHYTTIIPSGPYEGHVLIAGGKVGNGVLPGANIFDPSTLVFSPVDELVALRDEVEGLAALASGKVLISRSGASGGPLPPDPSRDPPYESAGNWAAWEMDDSDMLGRDAAGFNRHLQLAEEEAPLASVPHVTGNGRLFQWGSVPNPSIPIGASSYRYVNNNGTSGGVYNEPMSETMIASFFLTANDNGSSETTDLIKIYDPDAPLSNLLTVSLGGVGLRTLHASYLNREGVVVRIGGDVSPFVLTGETVLVTVSRNVDFTTKATLMTIRINNIHIDSASNLSPPLILSPGSRTAFEIGANGGCDYTLSSIRLCNGNSVQDERTRTQKLPSVSPDPRYIVRYEMDETSATADLEDGTSRYNNGSRWSGSAHPIEVGVIGGAREMPQGQFGGASFRGELDKGSSARMEGNLDIVGYLWIDSSSPVYNHSVARFRSPSVDSKNYFELMIMKFPGSVRESKRVMVRYGPNSNPIELVSPSGLYTESVPFHFRFRKEIIEPGLVNVQLWINDTLADEKFAVPDIAAEPGTLTPYRIGGSYAANYWIDSFQIIDGHLSQTDFDWRLAQLSRPFPQPDPPTPPEQSWGGSYVWDPSTGVLDLEAPVSEYSTTFPVGPEALVVGGTDSLRFRLPSPSSKPFNGSFLVDSVLSPTSFAYLDSGPNTIGIGGIGVKHGAVGNGGTFVYDVSGLPITKIETVTTQPLGRGQAHNSVKVVDSSLFPNSAGWIVLGLGYEYQTVASYLYRPNTNELTLNPSTIYNHTIPAGSSVTLLTGKGSYMGESRFYITDSVSPRIAVEDMLNYVAPSGSEVHKQILYPSDRGLGGGGTPRSDKTYVWGEGNV